jgi:hypothetical protein
MYVDVVKLVRETPPEELNEMIVNARIKVSAGSKSFNDRLIATLSIQKTSISPISYRGKK